MANNGKALLAAAIAGLMVIGVAYWWNRRDDNPDVPRAGCTTVVVTASVEKADLMAEIAKSYNASDRQVNGSCHGISVNATPSGIVESRLAEASWDPAWGPAPDAWSPASSTWLQLLRHDRSSRDRPDILPAQAESVVSTPIVLAMPEPMARALGWPDAAIGWSDLLNLANHPDGWGAKGHPEWGAFKLGKTNPNISTTGLSATVETRGGHWHIERSDPGHAEGPARARVRRRRGEVGRALWRHRAHLPVEPAAGRRRGGGARLCRRGDRRGEIGRGLQQRQPHRRSRDGRPAR